MTTQAPKKRGCFFYGCITVLVLLMLVMATLIVGTRYFINTMIDGLTEDKPVKVARTELPTPQMEAMQKRVDAFKAALDNPKDGFELVLSAEEFNALIASSPDLAIAKDKLSVQIEDDKLKADLSWPLDELAHFPLRRLKGRYLNGSATLKVALTNGFLNVNLDSLKIKGQPVDGKFMTSLQSQNLAQGVSRNPKQAAAIGKFDSIQVKDGKIIIKIRPQEKEEEKKPDAGKQGVEAI